MKLVDILHQDAILPDLQGASREEILGEMAISLAQAYPGLALDAEKIQKLLVAREALSSTGIGDGVAIPHGRMIGLPQSIAALGVHRQGIDFRSIDRQPAHLFFVLLSPEGAARDHLSTLARICRLLKASDLRRDLVLLDQPALMYAMIQQRERSL